MRFFIVALLWLWFAARVQAAQKAAFVSPQWQDTTSKAPFAANGVWPLGSSQIIAFTAPWDSYRIEFWQGILSGGARKSHQLVYNQSEGQTLPQSFYWTVQTYDLQLSQSPVFFFWLYDNNNSSNQQSSPNFNITLDTTSLSSSSSSTALLPTTSSVSSGTTSAATQTTPGAISPSTPPQATDISTGLSRGAAAGIGVGAALGGAIIVAAAALLFWKRRQRRRSEPTASSSDPPETADAVPVGGYYPKPVEAASYEWPVEAPAYHDRGPIELG
ncbi:hypothetical protein F4803DRAFT_210565 [Xylaria telfairii]|nr:hypothetical protein F4803DRAFT_210565 [Xylaria telfairii]